MKSYDNPRDYKDEILKRFKKYNLIVHTEKEKDYDYLYQDDFSIELTEKDIDNTMFIDLEGEITIYWDDAHCHFYYEERKDYEDAMIFAEDVLNNRICSISILCNDDWCCTGFSEKNEIEFNEFQAFEKLINMTDGKEMKDIYRKIRKYGATIKFEFWNKLKNYEYSFDKEKFDKYKL